ncbi:depupylase/deamidase Dop [Dermabacter sp. Marseille-Q3180]|uniref:depupylase/deamidase Dop n=1 Tax=Dermabacter sp. Marseille-Q3180 TaxID=2758090 RepID=UPI002024BA9B|nr:depupylase/deamidase Dop [Dermabacter sp. Marseille-Q3180]
MTSKLSPLTTRRAMGIETEFGIVHTSASDRERAGANASIRLSHYAVAAYALLEDSNKRRVRWDYGDETPLRDARGFELQRAAAHPTQLTNETHDAHVPSVDAEFEVAVGDDIPLELDDAATLHFAERRAIGNAVLRNGARLYVDHAHPEYSSPEVMTAREGLLWDKAGEEIARRAMARVEGADGISPLALFKNNTDGKGQSYGTHENYLVERSVPFDRLCEILIPFFATRQILVGAGRVGIGTRGEVSGFQISSRADFFENEVGLETTLNRPIVNSRDESHADASRFRRLHVIIGDANVFETSTFLKLAMTSLVLNLAEREHATGEVLLPNITLVDPVSAVHEISHDLSLSKAYETTDGGQASALDIQRAYVNAVHKALEGEQPDAETREAVALWSELLDTLERDPLDAADRIEWVGKYALVNAFKERHSLTWSDPRLTALDLQFTDLQAEKSIYEKLARSGRARRLVSDEEIAHAVTHPPESTRAYLRGALVTHHREDLDSAGWDVVTVRTKGAAMRVRLADPALASQEWCEEYGIDPSGDLETILERFRQIAEHSQ